MPVRRSTRRLCATRSSERMRCSAGLAESITSPRSLMAPRDGVDDAAEVAHAVALRLQPGVAFVEAAPGRARCARRTPAWSARRAAGGVERAAKLGARHGAAGCRARRPCSRRRWRRAGARTPPSALAAPALPAARWPGRSASAASRESEKLVLAARRSSTLGNSSVRRVLSEIIVAFSYQLFDRRQHVPLTVRARWRAIIVRRDLLPLPA